MDSAHRHELKTNEMEKLARQAIPFFEQYGNHIAIGICVVSIALSAWIYFGRTSYNNRASAWTNLDTATAAAEFADVADRFSGTTAAPFARLLEADTLYAQGFKAMFSNREASLVDLKKAKEAYGLLASSTKVDPTVRERALFGLSRTQECLSSGDLTEAIKTAEQLLKEYPDTIFKAEVEEHVARLKAGGTQDFYAWFSKKDPKPAPPKKPADKVGGEAGPALPGSGPTASGPALPVPTLPIPDAPSTDTPAAPPTLEIPSDKPDADKPAAEKPEAKPAPATEKPAPPSDSKPGDEKPVEEKPEADKPAAEKPAAEPAPEEKPATPEEKPGTPEEKPAAEPKADEGKSPE